MAATIDSIAHALAPGVALTSAIFFSNGLTTRFSVITGRIRDLSREARGTNALTPARLESIRRQVDLLAHRARIVHRSIIVSYAAMLAFLMTMVFLLSSDVFAPLQGSALPFVFFGIGLACFTIALISLLRELGLATRTVVEDVRSSFAIAESRPELQ